MKYRVSQYIQPWEIDELERQIHQHIASSYYIKDHDVMFDVTMNVSDNIIDWEKSKLPKDYFLGKYEYLKTKLGYYFSVEFDTDETIQGAIDKKRSTALKFQDFVIWLDSDIYFSHLTLPYMIDASSKLTDEYFILSPQLIKYFDNSWDCLVNEKFIKEGTNNRDYVDLFSFDYLFNDAEVSVVKNEQMKLGAGWFNVIKSSLLRRIPLPDKLGSYGPDDTYLISTCPKVGTVQYILKNVVVSEIGKKFLKNQDYIKSMLSVKTQDKKKISNGELMALINEFYKT